MTASARATLGFVLFALLLPALSAYADGWPQRRGHGYYKLGFYTLRATHYYEPGGNRIAIPTVGDYTFSFYGEYGLTDRLTAIAYVPVQRITLNRQVGSETGFVYTEGDEITSLADPILGVRFGLLHFGGTVVSASLKLGLPLGNSDQTNGLYTGDGELNQQLSLEAGHSFYPIPAYAVVTAGFNQRSSGFSDEVVYGVEAGYTVANTWTIIGRVQGLESLKNGDASGGQLGFAGNDQRYLLYGAEVAYTHNDRYGVSLGVQNATRAHNVLSAPAFSLGLFLKR